MFMAKGAPFRSAAQFVDAAREVHKLSCLEGCDEFVCATYARVICAANLQITYELLSNCWAYLIVMDVGHAPGTSYLDVRVRFCTGSRLVNVHLVALPLHTNNTAAIQFTTASRALDVVDRNWRDKVVSIETEGERTTTGHVSGVDLRFQRVARFPVKRIWRGLPQLDLLAQKEYAALGDDTFVTTLTDLISYLRRQQSLQAEMDATCPKLVSNHWLSMKRVTTWLVQHRIRVVSYLHEKNPACKPSVSWWITALCLDNVATVLAETYCSLEGLSSLLSQQHAQFAELASNLLDLCPVRGPLSDKSIARMKRSGVPHVRRGAYTVTLDDALVFVQDQGLFALTSMEDLPKPDATAISKRIANLFLGLYSGVKEILAVRDDNNYAGSDPLPPVLPHSLVKIRTSRLCEFVRSYAGHLRRAGWSQTRIEQIEKDHKELQAAYRTEETFKESLNKCTDVGSKFCEAWELCSGRFSVLLQFASGLASMFPDYATEKVDCSLIGYEKDDWGDSLTSFALEGILHARQFDFLRNLSTQ